ncbi:hypothetical protein [Bowdeniella massiliensis]|uniref:hypothetical protein n=1 Tax=Bowdeniella massiliensis TaxID=2932264 RepID=UPI002027F4C2|nr:hypothetical protein [Bowdeniella massiliensis]
MALTKLSSTTESSVGIYGIEQLFHEIGKIFTGAKEMGFDTSIFREDATFDEVLEVRAEHQQLVTDFLAEVAQEQLAE